jgi:predicted nucleic acid-binding protein
MRIVIDTNVFVSAGLKKNSLPNDVVYRLVEADTLLKSASTEKELTETLARARLIPLIAREFRDFVIELLA